jgi:predicted ABC-class ATPase
MASENDLRSALSRIDGKGYKAYKDIKGSYGFARFQLILDHIQGDPFAAPSRARIRVEREEAALPRDTTANRSRLVACCDFLTRIFSDSCRRFAKGRRGTGKSGAITIDTPGQEILPRSSMRVTDTMVEARFRIALPARGRKIAGDDAAAMFFEEISRIVQTSLFMNNLDKETLYGHIESAEDADTARALLAERGLVSFIADNSLLPRRSGIDPRPMPEKEALRFQAPAEYRVRLDLPNKGPVDGMGIPEGVTLIVGGGYHGKSTLLSAIETGIYNHIPGDGRELSVTVSGAQKIRASDGRNVEKTDISSFINDLPFRKDTTAFSTRNASGSTSQAAGIAEAVEAGARALLLDEDTSATNFMIRDERMQKLVKKKDEPITPFIDKIRQLYDDYGISTILVMGGSGDYFETADRVIQMSGYQPRDVTREARRIAEENGQRRHPEGGPRFGDVRSRIPMAESFNPYKGGDKLKIAGRGVREILYGRETIDISDLEQLVDPSQTSAIARAIHHAAKHADETLTLMELAARVMEDIEQEGLDVLSPHIDGELAAFRLLDLAGAINRMRSLKIRSSRDRP